jgi:hypothetical protein
LHFSQTTCQPVMLINRSDSSILNILYAFFRIIHSVIFPPEFRNIPPSKCGRSRSSLHGQFSSLRTESMWCHWSVESMSNSRLFLKIKERTFWSCLMKPKSHSWRRNKHFFKSFSTSIQIFGFRLSIGRVIFFKHSSDVWWWMFYIFEAWTWLHSLYLTDITGRGIFSESHLW